MWLYYLTGCALAFDAKFLALAGCLDERFFMYGEDVEYSARAARLGLPIRILDEVLVTHFGSKSSKPASLFYEYHINRSHLMLCRCLFDKPVHQWRSLAVKLPVLLCRALHRSIAHRTPCPLIGFFLSPISLGIRP
jgi:GT2 family glycosyltransferase